MLWAASGLETTAFQALSLAAFAAYTRGLGFHPVPLRSGAHATQGEAAGPKPVSYPWLGASGALLLLATLARPEAVVVAGAFALGLAWRVHLDPRAWLTVGLTFLLPFAAYHLWRLDYFGQILPHSVVCKADSMTKGSPLTDDLRELLAPFALLAAIYPWRRLGSRHVVLWLVPIAYGFLLYEVDPIVGYWNRHGLLAYALTLLAATVGLHEASRVMWPRARRTLREGLILALAVGYSATFVEDPTPAITRQVGRYVKRDAQRGAAGAWLAAHAKPSDWVVVGDVGHIPYELHAKVMDSLCLNSLEFTNPPIERDARRFADYVYRLKPRFLVIHSSSGTRLKPRGECGTNPALVRNPDFRRHYTKRRVFGASGDAWHYWIFERTR